MQEWQEKIEQEFEQFKAEVREEVKHLKEQRTDEMKAINVNVASADVTTRLDTLKQELDTHSDIWLNTLQENYTEHKHDIANVQTVQKGHSKFFEEHGKRLAATATKEDIATTATKEDLGQLRNEMATKNDIAAMKNDILDAMKQLLQQRPSE